MKKKITITVIVVLLVITLITGFTYAYWRLTYTQTGVNKVISSCFSMELANEKNSITLDSAYPISDEKGKSLTPYSFTITNTCDLFASYTINLEMLSGTTLNSKYVKTMVNSEAITNLNNLETTDTSIEGATESRVLFKGSLGSGDSTDYTLRIWMDSETPPTDDTMNKIFQGKITVTAEVSTYSPVENGFTNLAEALLVNEYQTTSLDVAKNKINSKQEVDFSKTAPIIVWEEKESSITTTSAGKIDESVIGNYGVTEKTVKLLVGTSYSFDSETGYYKLENGSYYDPIALDYVNNNYYYCIAAVSLGANDIIKSDDATSCSTMYKLMALTSVEESPIILSDGTEVPSKKYNFKALKYTEVELESDKSDKGLYESLDDDGTTYYYRGNVTNNYVKFAGYYWRIIRINGDGSIRLLYSGTSRDSFGADLMIATSVFNSNRKSHTYVGYMYSNTINTSYEDTIKNENNSIIKSTIDNWYNVNIEEKGYSSYIADSGFCNDRSISNDSIGDGSNDSISTLYSAEKRVKTYSPSLICPNATNDLFTLAGNTKGNNKLTYPIGLMTIDEILYAGLKQGYINKLSYIQANYDWWTMTPVLFDASSNTARVFNVREDGATSGNSVTSTYGVRPVINLKSTTEITGGIGTSNDPFIIK